MSRFGKSECQNGYLHRYIIDREWSDGVTEICEICHDVQFYKVIDERVDNIAYLEHHERDILMPIDRQYANEYGK